jgi:ABC-type polysaccharide/polyol phosphate transport system ATPase subunit
MGQEINFAQNIVKSHRSNDGSISPEVVSLCSKWERDLMAEMTGRENIYLNGAILGMTKKEISL